MNKYLMERIMNDKDEYNAFSRNFEGKTYILTDSVYFAGILPPFEHYNDVPDGAEYSFEMACDAIDSEGTEYIVYWKYTDRKDENEKYEDAYDYGEPTRVELKENESE